MDDSTHLGCLGRRLFAKDKRGLERSNIKIATVMQNHLKAFIYPSLMDKINPIELGLAISLRNLLLGKSTFLLIVRTT